MPPSFVKALAVVLTLAACAPAQDAEFAVFTLPSPAASDSGEPNLAATADGRPVLSWLEHGEDITALRFSEFRDGIWQPARTVAQGANWFVNWADFGSVVPINRQLWAAHWLQQNTEQGFAYDVAIAMSHDAGRTWGAPVSPHADGTRTEHGFVSLFSRQSAIGAVWLDGRNMAENALEPGGMTLRSAILQNDAAITDGSVIDKLVCDCCQTDVAVTNEGPVVAYRNRTASEIRDIYVTRLLEGRWQQPVAVAQDGWEINGCPVNGPAIVAHDAHVAVAWYTAADKQPKIQVAWSEDGAITFAEPIKIDIGAVMGRVSLALADEDSAIVSWLRRGGHGEGEICVRRIMRDGNKGQIRVIARTDISRPSGFPQIAVTGNKLVIARTDISGDKPQVITHWVDLTTL